MSATFRLAETTRMIFYVGVLLDRVAVPQPSSPSAAPIPEAREALGRVEIKVAFVDDPGKPEKVLQSRQLADRVRDEAFAADEVESFEREVTQPAGEMSRVQSDPDRSPRRVDWRTSSRRVLAVCPEG